MHQDYTGQKSHTIQVGELVFSKYFYLHPSPLFFSQCPISVIALPILHTHTHRLTHSLPFAKKSILHGTQSFVVHGTSGVCVSK